MKWWVHAMKVWSRWSGWGESDVRNFNQFTSNFWDRFSKIRTSERPLPAETDWGFGKSCSVNAIRSPLSTSVRLQKRQKENSARNQRPLKAQLTFCYYRNWWVRDHFHSILHFWSKWHFVHQSVDWCNHRFCHLLSLWSSSNGDSDDDNYYLGFVVSEVFVDCLRLINYSLLNY